MESPNSLYLPRFYGQDKFGEPTEKMDFVKFLNGISVLSYSLQKKKILIILKLEFMNIIKIMNNIVKEEKLFNKKRLYPLNDS